MDEALTKFCEKYEDKSVTLTKKEDEIEDNNVSGVTFVGEVDSYFTVQLQYNKDDPESLEFNDGKLISLIDSSQAIVEIIDYINF